MSIIYCQRCSAELPEYAKFCHRCGMRHADELDDSARSGNDTFSSTPNNVNVDSPRTSTDSPRGEDVTLPINQGSRQTNSGSNSMRSLALSSAVAEKKDTSVLPLPLQLSTLDSPRAIHQQSQIPVVTQQAAPSTVVYKKQETSRRAVGSSRVKAVRYTFIGTCVVLLVGLVVLFTNPFFGTRAQVNVLPSPTLTIINTTSVFPGGSITLHGANFTPDATVSFSSYGSNLPLASAQPSALPVSSFSSLDNFAFSVRQARLQRAYVDARVQYDGTFDLALSVPSSWQAETVHKIEAKESRSGRTAFVDVKVLTKGYATSSPASQSTLQAA